MTTAAKPQIRAPSPARNFPSSRFPVISKSDKLEEENHVWYSTKNWYPIQIGEVFQDRYQVITKIGYGTASTSWLARDLNKHRYVTIKVYAADQDQGERELAALKHINSAMTKEGAKQHPGSEFVRMLLDSFTAAKKGSKANLCLVFNTLGMSLSELANNNVFEGGIPIDVVKGVTFHLLAALDFLHSQTNVVHADIQEGNVMFAIESEDELREVEEQELVDLSPRKVHKDGHVIFATRQVLAEIEYPVLCDFGEARFGQVEYEEHAMPDLYRAPEILLGYPWTNKIDIWALGLMIWGLVEGKNLFNDNAGGRWKSALPHMARMISLLGAPPQHMLDGTTATKEFFDKNGQLKKGQKVIPTSLEAEESKLDGDEKKEFVRFVSRMLQWDPEKRPTAKELAEDPWPKSVHEDTE
ncbi:hypothetical protein VMCG_07192 [Cytospora schulzeri]|uniref:non-specific serine/threonine protein kinase n=1 Tax=Cytospora schulzeri TaxID=448051 RepID=A0A423W4Z1_9PEZI|nr:hypothetical protein VMCG_07192 [Valsa malicola]